jgi:hypothetical protein
LRAALDTAECPLPSTILGFMGLYISLESWRSGYRYVIAVLF